MVTMPLSYMYNFLTDSCELPQFVVEKSCNSFIVAENEQTDHGVFGYTWDDKTLTLLDSVGEPTPMVFNYSSQDNTFYRDMSNADDEMVSIFKMIGITKMPYRQIR